MRISDWSSDVCSSDLPDWNALAAQDDDTLPLLGTALLIARDEYPDLDPARYDALLQAHADELREQVDAIEPLPLKMQAINRHLFEELGYAGNHEEIGRASCRERVWQSG